MARGKGEYKYAASECPDRFSPVNSLLSLHWSCKNLRLAGRWERGKVAFGAKPQEYIPSDEELLVAELGDRLANYVATHDSLELVEAWNAEALLPLPLEYRRFDFRHADVMGSGRYFYASKPLKVLVEIPRQEQNAVR